jgi:ABC-type nitrate/sulfonate/bicarbonate transport system substrate-binding protein
MARRSPTTTKPLGLVASLIAAALLAGAQAHAETLRVGKVVAQNFGFVPLNVGVDEGFFKAQGLDIKEFDFAGGAKQQQAVLAGGIDIAISGGTDMGFIAKGSPITGIAAITTSAKFFGFIAGDDPNLKAIADLKGKKVGVTTAGSTTKWMVDQLNRSQGWGANGAIPVAIGGALSTELAALKTHEVAAFVDAPAIGYQLESDHAGHLMFTADAYLKKFQVFVLYAANPLVAQNPGAIRRFLKGWFQAIQYMRGHRDETVEIARKITGFSKPVEQREYDLLMPAFSTTGAFDSEALATLAQSFVDLKMLPQRPDTTKFYTEKFLPQ